jgi:RND family efflux transporter MFP subunit
MVRSAQALALVLVFTAGCGRGNTYAPPPPPPVTVARPLERDITTFLELTGQTRAIEAVEIRARVKGVLESVNFQPSTDVKRGDLLFVIEPELYQARVDQAQADLQSAEARFQAAEEQHAIAQAIFKQKAGSRTDLVEKQQARDEARAAVAQTRATLAAAQLDLEYTHVHSPIDGRIDRNYVDAGNLVGADEPTLLATVVRWNPIYAYFQVSERDLLVYRELDRVGKAATAQGERATAYMALATDEGFPHVGEVDYAANKVDPSTGTFEARAVFDNPSGVILPGLFVRMRVPFSGGRGLVVPEEALGADQVGRYALAVDAEGMVQQRRVEVGAVVDGMRVIQKGLGADDWVVVTGIQRARPGAKVTPVKTELPAVEAAAPNAPSGAPGAGAAQ